MCLVGFGCRVLCQLMVAGFLHPLTDEVSLRLAQLFQLQNRWCGGGFTHSLDAWMGKSTITAVITGSSHYPHWRKHCESYNGLLWHYAWTLPPAGSPRECVHIVVVSPWSMEHMEVMLYQFLKLCKLAAVVSPDGE